jgi:hypothetical protein
MLEEPHFITLLLVVIFSMIVFYVKKKASDMQTANDISVARATNWRKYPKL